MNVGWNELMSISIKIEKKGQRTHPQRNWTIIDLNTFFVLLYSWETADKNKPLNFSTKKLLCQNFHYSNIRWNKISQLIMKIIIRKMID